MSTAFQTAEEAMTWITDLKKIGIRPGLERMQVFMEKFNHPERRLRFIHVAGTNGKGSVCAYLTSVLRKCGYDVGMFTSPYLSSYTNRLQYNGQDIEDKVLITLANKLKPVVDELAASELGSPTMFEVTTALALLYYGTIAFPDYVVWETGLGGRLDVTNIVSPVACVITNIGHDHMDILGPTLADVAREKSGIIKPGVPVISTVSQPEIKAIIRNTAVSKKATVYQLDEQFSFDVLSSAENEQYFGYRGPFRAISDLKITMNGVHQTTNAAAAVMALEVLRNYCALIVDEEALREGLQEASWPGRLEMISREPRILLDGAHNPEGMEALSAALRSIYTFDQLNVVMAMMPNKNHEHSLRHILPMIDTLIITEPDFHRKMDAAELASIAGKLSQELGGPQKIVVEPDLLQAMKTLCEISLPSNEHPNPLGLVTGTLYLIADARSWLLRGTKTDKGW